MRTITTLFTLAVLAIPLSAQAPNACSMLPDLNVGHWSSYTVDVPEMGGTMNLRLAVVGTDQVDGATHHWVEMKMNAPMGEMIMQVLVPGYPYDEDDISQMIMKAPGQAATRMTPEMLSMMRRQGAAANPAGDIVKTCQEAQKIGDETVVVGAGSFDTEHYRVTEPESVDAWISSAIPFGIVKIMGDDVPTMELQGHGTDATSSITDIP